MSRSGVCAVLAWCVLAQAFCLPAGGRPSSRPLRAPQGFGDNDVDTGNQDSYSSTSTTENPFDDDDDDDFEESLQPASTTGGGSNIFSLLNLATALFPSSSSANIFFRNMIKQYLPKYPQPLPVFNLRRKDVADNVIEVDYVKKLTPPFQRQESEDEDEDDSGSSSASDENDAEEESTEDKNNSETSKPDSASVDENDSDYSDEPPGGGDGQGGGILGLLAGLSGGEDGQSDLGSLLAAVSGIVVNLSGDGFDLNALIASGLGLFVGLLSEGEENPGSVIASYLLTSLDTITGGGSKNNGAFFGNLLSMLVKGTSAVGEDSEASSEENAPMKMSDSTGFFVSLLMSLLGDMSKGSSSGSSSPW